MNIDCIYKYKICCYIYSALNNKKHSNITFRINNTLYNHNTRQVQHIFLVNVTSNYGKKSIHYQGIQIYNSLPLELKNVPNLSAFKNKLKKHLLNTI